MARVRLLHWKASEAKPILQLLQAAGHVVEYEEQFRTELLGIWRRSPPEVFVIDLSRLPSQGREIAIAVRRSPATRHSPVIFCDGQEQKVAALRALMPDAIYCTLPHLASSIVAALVSPPAVGVLPIGMMDRYRERSTAQKLGIKCGSKLAVFDPPPYFENILGDLPAEVELVAGDADVTLCFLNDPDSVRRVFSEMRSRAGKTRLWMLWQKKTARGHRGVTERTVRETGLSLGLVDYKICSVDKDWSGMLFARKNASL